MGARWSRVSRAGVGPSRGAACGTGGELRLRAALVPPGLRVADVRLQVLGILDVRPAARFGIRAARTKRYLGDVEPPDHADLAYALGHDVARDGAVAAVAERAAAEVTGADTGDEAQPAVGRWHVKPERQTEAVLPNRQRPIAGPPDARAVQPDRAEEARDHDQMPAVRDPVEVEQLELLAEPGRE
jgi:hypothetical protein